MPAWLDSSKKLTSKYGNRVRQRMMGKYGVGTAYREDVSERVCAKKKFFVRLRGTWTCLFITFLGVE
jgi:hypothetical protein